MLAVTTRLEVKTRLARVAGDIGLPAPQFFASVRDALAARGDRSLLFLDLGVCCREAGLRRLVGGWVRRHPHAEIILLVPLLDRECETHAMFELAALGVGRVMTASDFARPEVWATVRAAHALALVQQSILDDFRREAGCAGRPVAAAPVVERILANVHLNASCYALARHAAPRWGEGSEGSEGARRKALWQELRGAGQMPASWLVLVFRVVWYARLRELGWGARAIATLLGFRTTRLLRMTLKRRFGVCMRELHDVRYEDALRWAVAVCTADHRAESGRARERLPYPPLTRGNKPVPLRNEPAPAS